MHLVQSKKQFERLRWLPKPCVCVALGNKWPRGLIIPAVVYELTNFCASNLDELTLTCEIIVDFS